MARMISGKIATDADHFKQVTELAILHHKMNLHSTRSIYETYLLPEIKKAALLMKSKTRVTIELVGTPFDWRDNMITLLTGEGYKCSFSQARDCVIFDIEWRLG